MKILKYLLIGLGIIALLIVIVGVFAPTEHRVERTVTIQAPFEEVMPQVASLRERDTWSPWLDMEPTATVTYEGEDGAVGSKSFWEGNEIGSGMQEILAVHENRVESRVKFFEPWESEALGFLTVDKTGAEEVNVTWAFETRSPFPFNTLMLVMNMDEMIGKDFEKGLNKLKAKVESNAADKNAVTTMSVATYPGGNYIGYRDRVKIENIQPFFTQHLGQIYKLVGESGSGPAGVPVGIYYEWNEETGETDVAASIPVTVDAPDAIGEYKKITLPESKALVIDYFGAYENMEPTYDEAFTYLSVNNLVHRGNVIEEYITDPGKEPDQSKWHTRIYILIE